MPTVNMQEKIESLAFAVRVRVLMVYTLRSFFVVYMMVPFCSNLVDDQRFRRPNG